MACHRSVHISLCFQEEERRGFIPMLHGDAKWRAPVGVALLGVNPGLEQKGGERGVAIQQRLDQRVP